MCWSPSHAKNGLLNFLSSSEATKLTPLPLLAHFVPPSLAF